MSELDAEMADGILREIGNVIRPLPCCHGAGSGERTPPMFYAEQILCIMVMLRKEIIGLGGKDPFTNDSKSRGSVS